MRPAKIKFSGLTAAVLAVAAVFFVWPMVSYAAGITKVEWSISNGDHVLRVYYDLTASEEISYCGSVADGNISLILPNSSVTVSYLDTVNDIGIHFSSPNSPAPVSPFDVTVKVCNTVIGNQTVQPPPSGSSGGNVCTANSQCGSLQYCDPTANNNAGACYDAVANEPSGGYACDSNKGIKDNPGCPNGLDCISNECWENCQLSRVCHFSGETCGSDGYCAAGGSQVGQNACAGISDPLACQAKTGCKWSQGCIPVSKGGGGAIGQGQQGDPCIDDKYCDVSKNLLCDPNTETCQPHNANPGSGSPPAPSSGGPQAGSGSPPAPSPSLNPCGDPRLQSVNGICVPIGPTTGIAGVSTLTDLIFLVIKYMLILAGLIAVVALVVGGFWYITSGGNEEQSEKGKKAILSAVIGLAVVIMAYAIVNIITSTLTTNDILKRGTNSGTSVNTTP